jgi:hypothetical protein
VTERDIEGTAITGPEGEGASHVTHPHKNNRLDKRKVWIPNMQSLQCTVRNALHQPMSVIEVWSTKHIFGVFSVISRRLSLVR